MALFCGSLSESFLRLFYVVAGLLQQLIDEFTSVLYGALRLFR